MDDLQLPSESETDSESEGNFKKQGGVSCCGYFLVFHNIIEISEV